MNKNIQGDFQICISVPLSRNFIAPICLVRWVYKLPRVYCTIEIKVVIMNVEKVIELFLISFFTDQSYTSTM